MRLRLITTVLRILVGLVLIGSMLALGVWQFGNSANERGAVVLFVYVPAAILFVAAVMIGGALGRRKRKSSHLESPTASTHKSETEMEVAVISDRSRRFRMLLVYTSGAVVGACLLVVGLVLIDAPAVMFIVVAITCLAMVYGGVLLARRVT